MSRYHRDDGTFTSGLFTAIVIAAAFICGYALRDSGFIIRVNQPQQQEVRP
jgi:hypothetical protein